MPQPLTIWSNADLPEPDQAELKQGLAPHTLLLSSSKTDNLGTTGPDPGLAQADIAFGQPDPSQIIALPRLKWIQLTSAGYTRYDRADIRAALTARAALLTTSSSVYAEPCAQHLLAMMLAFTRCLAESGAAQTHKRWSYAEIRCKTNLLDGQTVLIVGYGAIGRRLTQLLSPFQMKIIAIRRSPSPTDTVECHPPSDLDALLPRADHVIDTLPASPATEELFNADLFARMKPTANFYNVGRGSTVDQYALRVSLETGRIHAAYLDVLMPEPLAPDDPLWTTPNCHITPHIAGGHADEHRRIVRHFLDNLQRFTAGAALVDRVI